MKYLHFILCLTPQLAQAASRIYTGFNYGAFWSVESNVKDKDDFLDGFNLAKNLDTPVSFDSARLFTCKAAQSLNDASGAFDAAVESKTNLLLGFWITPYNRGDSPDKLVENEMIALEKGFQKHGQALADIVIGLSVGSEDIFRWEEKPAESGLSADVVAATIQSVKKSIASSSFAKYMEGKPIGHVDVAKHAVVQSADFYGMTAYPYWNKDGIDKAYESFHGSLENLKQRAGNTPIWIAEMGWPSEGRSEGASVASADNLQKFWTEVGCSVIGKYTTFWFELLKDSTFEQPDWGFIDIPSRQLRIKDLSCSEHQKPSASVSLIGLSQMPLSTVSTVQLDSTSSVMIPSQSAVLWSSVPLTPVTFTYTNPLLQQSRSTIHVNTTIYVTVQPMTEPILSTTDFEKVTVTTTKTIHADLTSSLTPTTTPANNPWCVTVAEIDRDGQLVTVAGGPADSDGECHSPPTFNGYPYVTSGMSAKPTHVPIGIPWCVTMADVDRNNQPLPVAAGPAGPDGKCSSVSTHGGSACVRATRTSDSHLSVSISRSVPVLPTSSLPLETALSLHDGSIASPLTSKILSGFTFPTLAAARESTLAHADPHIKD